MQLAQQQVTSTQVVELNTTIASLKATNSQLQQKLTGMEQITKAN